MTNLVYQLPALLLGGLIGILIFGIIIAFASGARAGGGANPLAFSPLAPLAIIPLILLLVMLSFLAGLIIPAALTQLVLRERLGAAFDLGAVFAFIRRDLGQYALAVALNFGATLLLGGLSAGTNLTFNGRGGRAFWLEPAFLVVVFIIVILVVLRVIAGFFVQLSFFHLLGQLCWYDRRATAGDREGG